jgi:hypothetical protein
MPELQPQHLKREHVSQHTQLGPESRVSVGPSVYARAFGPEVVLLDFGKGEYFGLDEVGAEIWKGIEKGCALSAIANRIVERFDVAYEEALRDTISIVDDMIESGLVRI